MAAIAIKDTGEARVLELSGRLDAASIRGVWSDARRALKEAADRRIVIDAEKVDYCDGAGIGLIVDMLRQRKRGGNTGDRQEMFHRFLTPTVWIAVRDQVMRSLYFLRDRDNLLRRRTACKLKLFDPARTRSTVSSRQIML